jgi:hypothetical protein
MHMGKFTGSNARGQKCKLLERRLRAYQRATSEHECDGNDKQNTGCNRQNLDSVIVWSVAV